MPHIPTSPTHVSRLFMGSAAMAVKPTVPTRFISRIGNTPLIDLSNLSPNPLVRIYGKCEFMNPGLSIKDRMVQYILDQGEATGRLQPGTTVVAASSGNTAAAIAMICSTRGYKSIVITNQKCSQEKVDALRAYGAEVLITKSGVPPSHPDHYQNIELALCDSNPSFFGLNQYDNPLNPEAYYNTLAPEIWQQVQGHMTHFIAASSTGGTISGGGRFFKERNPKIQCVSPDPFGSIFYDYWKRGEITTSGSYLVEGVGKDSIPKAMDFSLIDDMPRMSDTDAFGMCHKLAESEGILVGGSAGLNVACAVELAKKATKPAVMVAILCDSGVKYLSKIYNRDWLAAHGLNF